MQFPTLTELQQKRCAFYAIASLFLFLSWFSWNKTFHFYIDFGRELYVPDQITKGAILYKDLAYFNGPLSSYYHALLFHLFGSSFSSILLSNLVVIGLITHAFYRVSTYVASWKIAYFASIFFLLFFAFARLVNFGSMNFAAPYSHDITHGFLLALYLLIVQCDFFKKNENHSWKMFGMGVLSGAIFLSKMETTLVMVATMTSVFIFLLIRKISISQFLLHTAYWILGFILLPGIALLYFSQFFTLTESLIHISGGWFYIFSSHVSETAFYKSVTGTDDIVYSIVMMAVCTLLVVVCVSLLLGIAEMVRHLGAKIHHWIIVCALLLLFPIILSTKILFPFGYAIVPMLSLFVITLMHHFHCHGKTIKDPEVVYCALWFIFSLSMLLKMILNTTFSHYGFVLMASSTIFLLVYFLEYFLKIFKKISNYKNIYTLCTASICIFLATGTYRTLGHYHQVQTVIEHDGRSLFIPDYSYTGTAFQMQSLLDFLKKELPPSASLVTFPQSGMLNYLTHTKSPVPYINYLAEIVMYGEEEIVQDLDRSPPDYFVQLALVDLDEYLIEGAQPIGRDILQWVEKNYELLFVIEDEKFPDLFEDIYVYKRIGITSS